jgi:hypothetical protein
MTTTLPRFDRLRSDETLDLAGWDLSPDDALRLARDPAARGLRKLDLTGTGLDAIGLAHLADAGVLDGLADLLLAENPLGDAGAAVLATRAGAAWAELQLGECQLTGASLARLAPRLASVVVLGLGGNPLGDGTRHLTAVPLAVEELDLGDTGLGPADVEALVQHGLLTAPHALRLDGNPLGDAGARALTSLAGEHSVLGLEAIGLGPSGLQALLASGTLASAHHVGLRGNRFGEAGLAALLAHPGALPAVLHLDDAPAAMIAALRAHTRCIVATALPDGVVLTCPFCVEAIAVDDLVCPRCRGPVSDDAPSETSPAEHAAMPRRPCPRCARPVSERACRCSHCARPILSARRLAALQR